MGYPTSQVQQPMAQNTAPPDQFGGKGQALEDSLKKITTPAQSGQPQMGMPNQYSNTVGLADNQGMQPQAQSGKGKGN